MRIALIAPEIPDYALEYARIIAEAYDVLLIIPDKFRPSDAFPSTPRLDIAWVEWPRQRNPINVWFMWKISRRLRQWRPDVVHCLDGNYLWLVTLAGFLKPIPFITTIHDVEVHPGDSGTRLVPRKLVKALTHLSAAVIVHGEKLRSDAMRAFSLGEDRVFAFPHPPIRHYAELALGSGYKKPDDGAFRILFFGRIHEYKGLRYLIEAAPEIFRSVDHAKLIIAGQGDDFSSYRAMISDPSRFEIHNRFIEEAETARMFAEADVLVLPYSEASQSGVLLVALCFGLPVVATDVGEMAEVVRSAQMGIVVPPRDVPALASAVVAMATDGKLRDSCKAVMQTASGKSSRGMISPRAQLIFTPASSAGRQA